MKDTVVKIGKDVIEKDIVIALPDDRKITIQYRNYVGTDRGGIGASIDVLLPEPTCVYNWLGQGMEPAKPASKDRDIAGEKKGHIRKADQLCFIL